MYQPDFQSSDVLRKVLEESYLQIADLLKTYPEYKVTLNITGSTYQIYNKYGVANLAELFRPFYERGQIVFTTTSLAHLIMPLTSDAQFERQVKLNNDKLSEFLEEEVNPEIFFFPELFVDNKSLQKLKALNVKTAVVSENSLKSANKAIDFAKHPSGLNLIVRSTLASRAFENRSVTSFDELSKILTDENRTYNVVHDGEIFGHKFPEKIGFIKNLLESKKVDFVHFDESSETIVPISDNEFDTASWEQISYNGEKVDPHWKNPFNEVHTLQWELTNLVVNKIEELSNLGVDVTRFQGQIDYIQYSCQYWWASSLPYWNTGFVVYAAWNWVRLSHELRTANINMDLKPFIKDVDSVFSKLISTLADYDSSGWKLKNIEYFDVNILPLRAKGVI